VAVGVALGADQDPPLAHGRSALLATLTTTACNGLGPELLRAELSQLGATLEPRVDAESFGLSLRAPGERWREALDLAVRCARTPSVDSTHFVDAALRLQARLGARGSTLRLRARAAAEVAPRAPGLCAPWGEPGRLGNLAPRDLVQAFRDSQVGARWSVALVGPVPVEQASAHIARRLADLPSGALPKAAQPGQPELGAARALTGTPSEATTLMVIWSVPGTFAHRLGAGVFASALHALLSMADGIEVLWQDADVFPGGAFAALELRASAATVPQLETLLARASERLTAEALDEALTRALALATTDGRSVEAEAGVRAERLARRRLGAVIEVPTREEAQRLVSALRSAPARLALLR
jgi:predicted Zn-dependent peptidase